MFKSVSRPFDNYQPISTYSNFIKAGKVFVTTCFGSWMSNTFLYSLGNLFLGVEANLSTQSHHDNSQLVLKRSVGEEFKTEFYFPKIAKLSNDRFIYVYNTYVKPNYYTTTLTGISAQQYTLDGDVAGDEFQVKNFTSSGNSYINLQDIISFDEGNYVIFWRQQLSYPLTPSVDIYASCYTSSDELYQAEFRITNYQSNWDFIPAVTALPQGGFIVAYAGGTSSKFLMYGRRYDNNCLAETDEFEVSSLAFSGNTPYTYPIVFPSADMGYALIWVYVEYINNQYSSGAVAKFFDVNNVPIGSEVKFFSGEVRKIITHREHQFSILWQELECNGGFCTARLHIQNFDYALNATTFSFKQDTEGLGITRNIIALSDDNFIVFATSYGSSNILAQQLSESAIAFAPSFQINRLTQNSIYDSLSSAYVLDGNHFLYCWYGTDEPGTENYSNFCRRYTLPELTVSTLNITEGQTVLITNNHFNISDKNSADADLLFIISELEHGVFQYTNGTQISTSFSLDSVKNGLVLFIHDGSDIAPSFKLSASDGTLYTPSVLADITFINDINDYPILTVNPFLINKMDVVTISRSTFQVIDPDSSLDEINFYLSDIDNGVFYLTNDESVSINQFSYRDMNEEKINFKSNGEGLPSFLIQASDAYLKSPLIPSGVLYINFNSFEVVKGEVLKLSKKQLDIQSQLNPENISIHVMNVKYARFENANTPGQTINHFTLNEIFSGDIRFINNDAGDLPKVIFQFTDIEKNYTLPSTLTLNISLINGTTTTDPFNLEDFIINNPFIIASGIGGLLVLSAAIVGTVLIRKNFQDAHTRESNMLADAIRGELKLKDLDNFETEKGRRYTNAINNLITEFANQGMPLDGMGEHELKVLAKDVATAMKNKIRSDVTFFGSSNITVDDIERKISDVVQSVFKIRAGQDDTMIPMRTLSL